MRALVALATVCVALFGSACWADVTQWTGVYRCSQGVTGLTLTVTRNAGAADATAVFDFYAHPTNPDVPSGSFAMTGAFNQATRQLQLAGDHWLNQPPEYFMVGLEGQVAADGRSMSGPVVSKGSCTVFAVVLTGVRP